MSRTISGAIHSSNNPNLNEHIVRKAEGSSSSSSMRADEELAILLLAKDLMMIMHPNQSPFSVFFLPR